MKTEQVTFRSAPAIQIGGTPDKLTLEAAAAAILSILTAPCGDAPKVEAMITYREIAKSREVSNVSLSNFNIRG